MPNNANAFTSVNDRKVERIKSWLSGKPLGPVTLEFFPTARCNLDCGFCWRQDYPPEFVSSMRELSEDKCISIVSEAADMDVLEVMFKGGGEPTLKRRTMEFAAKLFGKKGIRGLIVTNGTLIDDGLAGIFVDNNWMEVTVSIDGPDAETHDALRRVPGTFNKAVNAIQALRRHKESAGTSFPRIKIHTVINNRNSALIGEMISLAQTLKADSLELDSLFAGVKASDSYALSDDQTLQFQDAVPLWTEQAQKAGLESNIKDFGKKTYLKRATPSTDTPAQCVEDGLPACLYPWFQITVQMDGSFVPCCVAGGNLKSRKIHDISLTEAWFKDMEEIRHNMLSGVMPEFCRTCSQFYKDQNSLLKSSLRAFND